MTFHNKTSSAWREHARFLFVRFAVLFSGCIVILYSNGILEAQETSPEAGVSTTRNWRVENAKLDSEYEQKLLELEVWCRDNKMDSIDLDRYKKVLNRDLWRQTIFIPKESQTELVPINNDQEARDKLRQLNEWQAQRLFELAKLAAHADAGGPAIQLLNAALFFNPDHLEIRRILSHKKNENGWALYSDRLEIRKATKQHEICSWPARSYHIATTPNFQIESNASVEQIRQLAEKLERWHYVWRQVYFDYWSNTRNLRRWMDGEASYSYSRRKFKLIVFKDSLDYLRILMPLVPGVEASTGYYSNPKNTSFFYFDSEDSSVEDTWKHELTHQLFRESIGTGKNLKFFEDELIWFDEGAATYAESLVDFGDYVTLGGFESKRMQYARVRLLLEGYQVPLSELNQLGRLGLQRRPDIVRLYGQIAGQYDMLMNDQAGKNESQLIALLQMLYRGKTVRNGKLDEFLGCSFSQFDERYRQYLIVDPDRIAKHLSAPSQRQGLSFAKSTLNDACFAAIGQCDNLAWLDVSGNRVSLNQINSLSGCKNLQQLILTQCQLEAGVLRALAGFNKLEEVDLSGSSVTDQQLLELQGQANLKKISVRSTHLTAGGIVKLKQLLPTITVVQ